MSMTIAQLKQELTSHGIPLPESSSRKEVYEKLYQEHVVKPKLMKQTKSGLGNGGTDTFSSDEEIIETNGNGVAVEQNPGEEVLPPEIVAEVEKLSNEEIYTALTTQGQEIGPVVASTRQMYKKRLVRLSVGRDVAVGQISSGPSGTEQVNGDDATASNLESPSQFSSDDEMEFSQTRNTVELESSSVETSTSRGYTKLTAEEKERLEQMLNSSYYSSPTGPSPSTSRRATSVQKSKVDRVKVESEVPRGFSLKTWIIGIVILLVSVYIAYEVYEESRTEAEPKNLDNVI